MCCYATHRYVPDSRCAAVFGPHTQEVSCCVCVCVCVCVDGVKCSCVFVFSEFAKAFQHAADRIQAHASFNHFDGSGTLHANDTSLYIAPGY